LATQRGRGGAAKPVTGGDQPVRLDVYVAVAVGGVQEVVGAVRTANITTALQLDFERVPWL
jgi:hypothetical protein